MTPPPTYQPGWYADPEGRYDFRYHNGQSWTNDVSRDGRRMVDGAGGDDDRHRDRRATAALVLAIIGLCLAWMPLFFVAGAACALIGIALGYSARRRVPRDSRGFAGLGMVIGTVALAVCGLGVWLTVRVYGLVDAYENPPATEVSGLACAADDDGSVTIAGSITNVGDRRSRFRIVVDVDPGEDRRHYAVPIDVAALEPGDEHTFSTTRLIRADGPGELSCTVSAVTGPPPLGITM